ncbi:MAG TPA: hypothetical protein VFD30_22980 [Terriglobia bacterium]|jgi:hypothetical protein|nr:hypothetical protein [Terriglobia bacterium]
MAIRSNTTFDSQNAALTKRPLYLVIIEGIPDVLTTFVAEDEGVSPTGYGMTGYGIAPYGY